MTCELVIFDCDGVLVDSERISHEVLVQMLSEFGVAMSFDEAVRQFMGASTAGCVARVGELVGPAMPADFLQRFAARSRQAFEAGLTPVPGIEPLLDALRCPYCVASNGNHAKVNFTLGHTGLLPRFAGRIFTAEDVARPKPAPDLFLHAARSLGAVPERCTVVEDTATGVRAAKAAGMRAIGYAVMSAPADLSAAGADRVARSMAGVRQLLVDAVG